MFLKPISQSLFVFFIVNNATLIAHMEDMEEDALLVNAANDGERQMVFQQQVGGSVTSREPGRFDFTLNPYVDRVHGCARKTLRGAFTTTRSVHPSTELEYETTRGCVQSYTGLDPS